MVPLKVFALLTRRYAADITRTTIPTSAACTGNSGTVVLVDDVVTMVVVELVVVVELDDVGEVEDEVDVVEVVVVLEVVGAVLVVVVLVVVVVLATVKLKVAVLNMAGGNAPQVAFTVYVPTVQAELPPATKVKL